MRINLISVAEERPLAASAVPFNLWKAQLTGKRASDATFWNREPSTSKAPSGCIVWAVKELPYLISLGSMDVLARLYSATPSPGQPQTPA